MYGYQFFFILEALEVWTMTYYGISSTAWYIIDAQYISEWMNFMLTFRKPFSEMFIFLMAPLNEWEWIKWTWSQNWPACQPQVLLKNMQVVTGMASPWQSFIGRWTCKLSVICRWMLLYLKTCLFLNWSIIALQCCVSVAYQCESALHIHALLPPKPPSSSHPSRSSPITELSAPVQQLPRRLSVLRTVVVFMSVPLSWFVDPPLPLPVPTSLFSTSVFYSCSVNRFISTCLYRCHMYTCINKMYVTWIVDFHYYSGMVRPAARGQLLLER